MGYYGYIGVDPEPADPLSQRRMRRGKLDEQVVVEELREKYGVENVRAQEAILWPNNGNVLGELHPDAYIVPERAVVEIKSHADGEPTDSDWVQVAGQAHWHEEAESGWLMIVDRDLDIRAYPLVLTDGWREKVEGRAATLVTAIETGKPPERRCAHPGEARGRFCPFAAVCFDGWQPPPAGDFEETALAVEFYEADRSRRAASEFGAGAEARYRAAKEALLEAGLRPGESLSGPFRLKRTVVEDSERVSLAKIRKAGVPWPDELYAPFTNFAGGYDRIAVERSSLDEVPLPSADDDEGTPF